jgi:hypothetical protein
MLSCAFSNIFYSFAELPSDHRKKEPKLNSEGTKQMTKNVDKQEISFLPLVFLAVFAVTLTVMSPANAHDVSGASIEKANYATYTPSMAARGQRFYVGP